MNIWIVNHFAYGPDQSAGTRHYSLARVLQERGHQTLVIASSFYHKGREEARLNQDEKYRRAYLEGVPFQWVRTPSYRESSIKRLWNMMVFGWRVYRGTWRTKDERPDVILGSSPSLFAALAGYQLACNLQIPFVLEIRDIWPDSLRDVGSISEWNPVYQLFKGVERFLYRRADAIVTVLPNSYEHIVANGGDREKISWIPNGVNLAERPPLEESSNSTPFTLIYFGAHGPYNGLDKVVEAAVVLRRHGWSAEYLRVVLIGEGPCKDHLMTMAHQEGVQDLLEFRPAVPKKELWEAIRRADAFLMIVRPMPSFEKGMSPNKLWDYFAAARPVLISTVGGDRIVEESGAGIAVTPGDPIALADGIERLYSMKKEERLKLGRNGRAYVQETADLPKLAEQLECVLDNVVSCYVRRVSQLSAHDSN